MSPPRLCALRALVFLVCAFASPLLAQAASGTLEQLQRKPGTGEFCIVCEQRIVGGEVIEMRYKGRRFHVAEQLLPELEKDPDRYFHQLEAHSALFDEGTGRTSGAWLWFGGYVLAGVLFGALCAHLAISRSAPGLRWFFAGFFGNVLGLVALLASRPGDPSAAIAGIPRGLAKVPVTHAPVDCGACGRSNHPSATACSSCGATLAPRLDAETRRLHRGGAS